MNPIADDILAHYGIARRSGRYPWGSGKEPFQRSGDFLSRVEELRNQKITYKDEKGKIWTGDTAIAKTLGLTSAQFRVQLSLANDERRAVLAEKAQSMRDRGASLNEIKREMGYANDSSVRSLLNQSSKVRMEQAKNTAEFLKKQIDEKGMIDVGAGIEHELHISHEQLQKALYILEMEGYPRFGGGVPQATNPGKQINLNVIGPPGTEHKDIYDFDKIHHITDYTSHDEGMTFDKFVYPASLDGKRVAIRYAEEGGLGKDGLVELRRGVDDISLGESRYAQVRILVDGKKYIKGMAVYSDDLPDGVDVMFNTNKKLGTPKGDVLKNIKNDPDNPFGSLIKAGGQSYYIDADGKKQLSVINKRAEEGDWRDWDDKLPAQFLSKQNLSLIKSQLNLTYADKAAELAEYNALTNPTVKKQLLQSFADDCDAAAVHLKAAALPGQKFQVIIPIPSLKDNEVYAPNFEPGSQVALVRFPHGGTFEIPKLIVNNKQADAKKVLGPNPVDAIGINSKVAERLSGADFDGDTVMVIPISRRVKISSTEPLAGLVGFDSKNEYGADKVVTVGKNAKGEDIKEYYQKGVKYKLMNNTQTEMGKISNLITDMTLKGATDDEKARAVRHSMVVIDAEKHHLNYKASERANGIAELKKKYQGELDENGRLHTGASTLISRSKSEVSVLKRKGSPKINQKGKEWYDPTKPEGAVVWNTVREEYTVQKKNKKTGEVIETTKVRTQPSTRMAEEPDARKLISSQATVQEIAYADYANKMKALANDARKEIISTGKIEYSRAANKTYQKEVASLSKALDIALLNKPKERSAQLMANSEVKAKKEANPDMTPSEIKKANQVALNNARIAVGAQRKKIEISDREWEAIQAGAISETKLIQIMANVDIDKLKQRATPRVVNTMSQAQISKIQAMKLSGYSNIDIAKALGKSPSTISKYLNIS